MDSEILLQKYSSSGSGERELGITLASHVLTLDTPVHAIIIARLRALAERVVDDGFDGPRAPAAFRAATETTVNLFRVTQGIVSGTDGIAYIDVAEDVAGTNDH